MEISTAILCDFAQVRGGLLFVASGGITRMWRHELPAPMNCYVAIVIEMDQIEAADLHEFKLVVLGQDGEQYAEMAGAFQAGPGDGSNPTERVAVPLAINLQMVGLPGYGQYDVRVYLDGQHRTTRSFWVASPPDQDSRAES